MSRTRIGIILLFLACFIALGTWGWTELANAVYKSDARDNDIVVFLTVYGVAILYWVVGGGLTFLMLSFRNDPRGKNARK